jgi:hypothetical protein
MINSAKYSVLFLMLILKTSAFGQVVTLEGKQFKNTDGSNFYPVVCNYRIDYAFDGTSFFAIPHTKYGSSWADNCANLSECQQRIQEDLHEMKLMGFNTIRIVAMGPNKSSFRISSSVVVDYYDHFVINYETFPNPSSSYPDNFLDVYPPYDNTNANLQTMFGQMDLVLNMAQAENLKVILLTGGGNYFLNNVVGTPSAHAADYAALLAAYADHFKNSQSLLAYDLYNEPAWSDGAYFHKKEEVCQWTASWYDAIKTNDPNHHLVTMGLNNWWDVLEWDPGVMKLDFLSQHIYPGFKEFEGYSLAPGMERYHDELVWMANNSPLPWIIGETGFAASNTANSIQVSTGVYSNFNYPPNVHGTENEQANFAELGLNEVRDAGGSGYSWWQIQDVFWYGPADPNVFRENWYGLLRYGDPDPAPFGYAAYRKPAVAKFQAFDPTASGTFSGPSASYYNPYNHPSNPNTITGHVTDQNGDPVKDAFVIGATPIFNPTGTTDIIFDFHYTFTNINGDFTLIPYDYDPRPPNTNNIEDFRISAIGSNRLERGWPSTMNPSSIGITTGQTYTLEKSAFTFNASVDGETVIGGTSENFQGKNTLTVSNTSVQPNAQSEFKAGNVIDVHFEFHATAGSEVHIYTTEVFPECFDFSTYRNGNPNVSISDEENSERYS